MYKNVIFDFGGVILNIDYQRTVDAFKLIGLPDFDTFYSQLSQSNLFDDFEMGKISPSLFREKLRNKINYPITDEEIDKAWNAMLMDLPVERIDFLDGLSKHKRIFLLSNTNAIHEKEFTEYIKKQYGTNVLESVFEKIYFSHNLGLRKPQKEIFDLVLRENNLVPQETLFIDDSPQHVHGGKASALNSILLEKNKSILDLFKDTN